MLRDLIRTFPRGIPDAPNGGGITATIDVYVDGAFRQAITGRVGLPYDGYLLASRRRSSSLDGVYCGSTGFQLVLRRANTSSDPSTANRRASTSSRLH